MTQTPAPRDSKPTARPRTILAALGAVAGSALLLAAGGRPGSPGEPTQAGSAVVRPNPGSGQVQSVHALARLEPASGLITVGSRPGARIEQVRVKEGDEVKPGDLLAILEGHGEAERRLALARAQKQAADRRRALQRAKLALERRQYDKLKDDRLKAAERTSKLTSQKYQEVKGLDPKVLQALGGDARSKYEIGQALYQLEVASIKAELDLKELQADQGLQKEKRALEDQAVDLSDPDDDVLARQVDLAESGVKQAEVRAPGAGRVLELLAHEGEVGSGPLLMLGDVSAMVARAEVYQSDVPMIAEGDPAEVQLFGGTATGRVTRIGRIVGRNELRSVDPRALQDLRVVKVSIALDEPGVASSFVNMEVDVTIRPSRVARK